MQRFLAMRVSSGSAIRRLNGVGSLRRSDSIRNSYSAGSKIPNCGSAKPPAAGNGIFGCRERAPKQSPKCANTWREQKSEREVAENPRINALFGDAPETR